MTSESETDQTRACFYWQGKCISTGIMKSTRLHDIIRLLLLIAYPRANAASCLGRIPPRCARKLRFAFILILFLLSAVRIRAQDAFPVDQRRQRSPGRLPDWAPTWWPRWSGASGCRWAERRATPSIPPETSGRGSRMQFCPWRTKGASDWDYAIVPVLGPILGGGLAGMLLRVIAK